MDRILVIEALVEVHELVDVQLPDLAEAGAPRAAPLRVVEAERVGIAHERLPHAGEQQPHQGIDVGVGAHRGPGVLGGLLLVNDHRDGQSLDLVHVRTPVLGQILLHEGREGVVQLPPRLRRDRVQHQRALPRARNAREHGNLVFGNVQGDVLQVVLPGAPDAYDVPFLHIVCEDTHFCGKLVIPGLTRNHPSQ